MKRKHNEGFTLVELLVSIAILSAIVLPTCTSLVLSYRLNAKAEQMLQAQLAVSSTVEKLMAEGMDGDRIDAIIAHSEDSIIVYDFVWDAETGQFSETDNYPDVVITIDKDNSKDGYYAIAVTDNEGLVTVNTHVRKGGVADHEKT